MEISDSKLIKFTKCAHDTASKALPEYSSKYSRKDFTQWQHVTLLCLMIKTKQKWEDFPDMIANMPYLCEAIGLGKIPHFTTLNKFFLRMKNKVLLVLILMSAGRFSDLSAVDATELDRRHNSKHYVKRCKITIKSMKLTLLIDTKEMKIIGIHCTATRKHDTQIILSLVKKTRQKIKQLCGDKGYDSKEIRDSLKAEGTRVLVPYREFTKKQKYWNTLISKKDYHQRSKIEAVNSVVKRKHKDFLSSHEWRSQHKEAALLCVVYNIDRDVKKGLVFLIGFLKSQKYYCKDCHKFFTNNDGFYRMRNKPEIITMSIDMYVSNLSSRKMRNQLKRHFSHKISHVSVLDWVRRYTLKVHKFIEKLGYNLGSSFYADETMINREVN